MQQQVCDPGADQADARGAIELAGGEHPMLNDQTRNMADRLVHEHAAKFAKAQGISIADAVEAVWDQLEMGLLRFANSDERFWIEPCSAAPGERRAARKATQEMIKCRRVA
jgi:hypothetical protein